MILSKLILTPVRTGRAIALVWVVLALMSCAAKKTDAEHVQQGRIFQEQNQWRAAVIEYKNALQINPLNSEARRALGVIYLELGNGAEAEKELRRARDPAKSDLILDTQLARALLLQNQHEKLLAEFPAASNEPGNANAELDGVRAEALAMLGKHEPAQALIDRVVALDAPLPAVMLSAARVSIARGDLPKAREWIRRATQSAPTDPAAWLISGELAYLSTEFDNAVAAYEKSLQYDARQFETMRNVRARIGLVYALLAQNKLDDALPHIEKLLKANPKHFLGNYLRGLVAFKKADFDTALDFMQRSSQDAPVNSPTMALLGAVHYAKGNYQQAELYLGKYVGAVPDDMTSRKLLGAVRLKLNQPEKALEAFGKADSVTDDAQLLALMGEAAAQSGEFSRGRELFGRALKTAKQPGQLQAQMAQTWIAQGDYDRALAQLELAAQDPQYRHQAKVLTVTTYLHKQDFRAALKAAQALVAERPDDAAMNNVLAGAYLASGDRGNARARFQRALELQPKFLPVLMNLAALDANEKNYPAARARWLRVLEIDPQYMAALLSLARLEDAENHPDQAVTWLEKARASNATALEPRVMLGHRYVQQRELDKAEAVAQEAIAAHPEAPAALLLSGDTQLAQQRLDQATVAYQKLTRVAPKEALGFLRLGQAQFAAKSYQPARLSLRNAYLLAPDSVTILTALVALETRLNDSNNALQRVEEFLGKHPDSSEGLSLRGDVYKTLGKFAAADESYVRAEKLRPSSTLVVRRYQVLEKASQESAGLELLTRWLEKHPDDEPVQAALAEAHRTHGRNAEAAEIYRRMLARKPESITALNNLALTYLAAKDARAKGEAEKAYALSKGHPYIADTYGWVLLQSGDVAQGKKILQQAAEQAPEQPDIQVHFAVALSQSGESARARELLTGTLKGSKNFETRKLAEETLAKIEPGNGS